MAVNIQENGFGNMGLDSGTGVGFTETHQQEKNYGEYL